MNLFTDNDVMSSPAETDLPAINVLIFQPITGQKTQLKLQSCDVSGEGHNFCRIFVRLNDGTAEGT